MDNLIGTNNEFKLGSRSNNLTLSPRHPLINLTSRLKGGPKLAY